MQVERAELAAVVAGRDAQHARATRRPDADAHRLFHAARSTPSMHDLVDGVGALRQGRS